MANEIRLSITPIEDDRLVFIANTATTEDTLTMTANGGYMLYLQNTSTTKTLVIDKIMASASTPGGVLRWMKGVMIENIDNANEHIPINTNGEEKAEVSCLNWNEIGDGILNISKGEKIKTFIINAGYTAIDVKASLGSFDNIALHYKHDVGMPEFECGIQFSYREIENG